MVSETTVVAVAVAVAVVVLLATIVLPEQQVLRRVTAGDRAETGWERIKHVTVRHQIR